jgi:hypothetical protein
MIAVVLAGASLGLLSRVEEVTAGLSLGLSSDSAWVAAAFAAGARAPGARSAALRAVAAMCAANGAYYAWVGVAERGTALAAAAGDPRRWVLAGVLTGLVFGVSGRWWRVSPPGGRLAAVMPLAVVLAIEGGDALRGAAVTHGIGLGLALVLPIVSARSQRRASLIASAGLAVLAASGAGAGALP